MTVNHEPGDLQMIPLDLIDVLNPRERDNRKFEEIVENIGAVGLKKPITVTARMAPDGSQRYLLICGEGRVKAFRALGEINIPALVVTVSDEDAFVMSLVENVARRRYQPLELLGAIAALRDQGYDKKVIATKTGLSAERVYVILTLLEHGEERLLKAVDRGVIPLSAAVTIANSSRDNKSMQNALQDAYESGKLRGKHLFEARRVIERRDTIGRTLRRSRNARDPEVTSTSLVRVYQKEVDRQRLVVRKAEIAQHRLLFVTSALRQLLADENFSTLLRAEGLDTLPTYLAERVWSPGGKV